MKKIDPKNISVNFNPNTSQSAPIIPRTYTIIHCNDTENPNLYVGFKFDLDNLRSKRDEIFARWDVSGNKYALFVDVYVGGLEFDFETQSERYQDFDENLPLAIQIIVYGDKELFNTYPQLKEAEILVKFHSIHPTLKDEKNIGYIQDYLI